MSLRNYQTLAIQQIREKYVSGHKKVLLRLATGAGKTVVFCEVTKNTIKNKKRVGIFVRGRKLVDQASQRLFREEVHHGVLMAKHWNYRPSASVQVCSIDTLIARGLRPEFDFIVIDEAHLAISDGYREVLNDYPNAYILSVTATPYTNEPLNHIADTIIHPITMQELIDQGFLVPFRYFSPDEPDLRGVKTVNGDYKNNQLEERMTKGQLTGDIIKHWVNIGEGRPTLLFAVNINHSKLLVEKFNEAGIRAEHCDADTPEEERNAIIKRLENGQTKIVSNVGIFCTGVDIPSLGAIILARPTQSYSLYIQQIGRGTRTFQGKENCILLDHAGNIRRFIKKFGFPTLEPEVDLNGKPKEDRGQMESKVCGKCFAIYRGKDCPNCGTKEPMPPRHIVESEGDLSEIVVTAKDPVEQYLEYLEQQRSKFNRKMAWKFHKLVDKFGIDKSKPYLPEWFVSRLESTQAHDPFSVSPFQGGR